MKKTLFFIAMALTTFFANAQTEVMKDVKKTITLQALSLNGDNYPLAGSVQGTITYSRFGQQGNTFVLELQGLTEETKGIFSPDKTAFYASGADIRLMEASQAGNSFMMVQKGSGANLPISIVCQGGKYVAMIKNDVETGLYIGMPKSKVETDVVRSIPNGSLKLAEEGATYNIYKLYSLGTRDVAGTNTTVFHDQQAYCTMYFDKSDKLVKWLRH